MKFRSVILGLTVLAGILLALGYGLFPKPSPPPPSPGPFIPPPEIALGEKVVPPIKLGPDPDAGEIVRAVDPRNTCVNAEFNGVITKNGTATPFKLRFKEGSVAYTFQEPWRKIQVTGRGANAVMEEFPNGSAVKIPSGKKPGSLPGNDLDPDDLFFGYLDWPNRVKQPNEERVKTRKCWVVDLYNDHKVGEYQAVRIFVDKESGSLLRLQGYDWQTRMTKVLAVTAGMKVDGAVMLKSMAVIRYIPGTREVAGETTVELKKP